MPIALGADDDGVTFTRERPHLADERIEGGGRDTRRDVFIGDGELVAVPPL